jgi:hypothetical protein
MQEIKLTEDISELTEVEEVENMACGKYLIQISISSGKVRINLLLSAAEE